MVSFDHRDRGTPESTWRGDPRWADLPGIDLDGIASALVIAAHPDDESLGAGGLVAALHGRGVRIEFLLATRGDAAHAADLSSWRCAEFAAAVAQLAPGSSVIELSLPDGRLREHVRELAVRVADAARRADVIIAPWRGDGHGDHTAAGEVAAAVAARAGLPLLEYPVWLWHWAHPWSPETPWRALVCADLDPASIERKRLALAAYASQTTSIDDDAPILHGGMLAHFARDWESFVMTAP